MKNISALSNHVIVCGGGILANRAASEFRRRHVPFALFVLALGHGVVTGTDTSAIWATLMYAGTGLSVLAMRAPAAK